MSQMIRRLTRNEYAFTVISRLLSFALGMVYSVLFSRYLQPELRGDVSLVLNYSSFLMLFLCLGINQGYPFFRREKPKTAYMDYINLVSAFFIVYCGAAFIFALVMHSRPELSFTAALIPFLFGVKELNYAVMIEKPYIRNMSAILLSLFDVVFILVFWLFIPAGYTVAMIFVLAKEVVYFIVAMIQTGVKIGAIRPSFRDARKYIMFGLMPMITVILMDVNYRMDVMMLDYFRIPKAGIGIYTLAVSLAEKIWLIPDAMKDMLVSRLAKGSSEEEVCRVTRISFVLVLVLSIVLAAAGSPVINLLYGLEYRDAYPVILLLLVGIVGMVFYKTVYSYNVTRGERKVNLIFLGIAAISNVAANWFLIPAHGIYGAAAASSISYFVCGAVFLIYFCRKTHMSCRSMTVPRQEDLAILGRLIGGKTKAG